MTLLGAPAFGPCLDAASDAVGPVPAFRHAGLHFVTDRTWNPPAQRFGGLAFLYGTLVSSAIALVLAVPVSLGIAQ